MLTGYPLSLPSKTLPLLPSPPACSFCDLPANPSSLHRNPTDFAIPLHYFICFAQLAASWSLHTCLMPSPLTLLHLRSYPLPYFTRTLSPTPVYL